LEIAMTDHAYMKTIEAINNKQRVRLEITADTKKKATNITFAKKPEQDRQNQREIEENVLA
jgi:hypothetical protein